MDLILQAWNPECQTLPGCAITEPFMYYSVYFLMIVRVRRRWTKVDPSDALFDRRQDQVVKLMIILILDRYPSYRLGETRFVNPCSCCTNGGGCFNYYCSMSATMGMIQSYADKSRWKPTAASHDVTKKALQDSSWADVCL